ncbi:MAG: septal ring lytic transglycosylase RlpA family protein [Ferruginibacter sp.]
MENQRNVYPFFIFILLLFFTLLGEPPPVWGQRADEPPKKEEKRKRIILYGQASFYANKFQGRLTANGERFSQKKFTAACNSLPLGTWIQVTNLKNGKIVVVKTNDRLHPKTRRLIDLTTTAAKKLGYISRGLTRVRVEVLNQKLYKQLR